MTICKKPWKIDKTQHRGGQPPQLQRRQYPIERKETPQTRYDRTHRVQIALNLNKGTDADILERLAAVPNKQGYIKSLIRADIPKATE